MTKKVKTTPAVDLLLPAAKIIKDNLGVFFLLLVVPVLLSNITEPVPELAQDATVGDLFAALRDTVSPYMIAGSLLTLLFYPFLTAAFYETGRRGQAMLDKIWQLGAQSYLKLIGLTLLSTLLIALGLVLFIIPGLIALRSFVLAPYYMIASKGKLGIIDSMKKSAKHSRPYKWSIYSIMALVMLFGIFSTFGVVGQICGTILSILYAPAFALRYHEIK